jgi:hypothetical protein
MSSTATGNPIEASPLRVGLAVHVNVRAGWVPATITSICHRRVGVIYHTDQPTPLAPRIPPWLVRPARGIRLTPIHHLRHGDEVVAFDGTTNTVDGTWRTPDQWWLIIYADGQYATTALHAVLRLADRRAGVRQA